MTPQPFHDTNIMTKDQPFMNDAAQPIEPKEVIVMLTLQFQTGVSSSVIDKMVPAVRLTRLEPGNIDFQFFKVKDKPDSVVIYERWKDQAALEWHCCGRPNQHKALSV